MNEMGEEENKEPVDELMEQAKALGIFASQAPAAVKKSTRPRGRPRKELGNQELCDKWVISTRPLICRRAEGHTGPHTAVIKTDGGGAIVWEFPEAVVTAVTENLKHKKELVPVE